MKINEIKETGFYKAIDNPHFVIEVLHISEVGGDLPQDLMEENKDALFVDVWYHDSEKPYNHKEGVYQSNETIYKIDAIPEIFDNMEFIDDSQYEHRMYGNNGEVMFRVEKTCSDKSLN